MAYFGGSSRIAGDPGFFGSLFGGVAKLGRAALGLTPVGRATTAVSGFLRPSSQPIAPIRGQVPQIPTPGARGRRERFFPGGATGFMDRPRRRRMNAGNAKALRRAIRRTDAFVRLSKSALKNTGFKIVSKSAGRMTEAQWQKRAHHAK